MSQNKKISIPKLVVSCIISLAAGGIGTLLAGGSFDIYETMTKPPLAPPSIIFPIVWSILYILMGIGSYFVYDSDCETKGSALSVYVFYLILNAVWPLAFFKKGALLAAFFLLAAQIILLFSVINAFMKCDKKSAWFILPTLLWSIFALYLNGGFLYLNS